MHYLIPTLALSIGCVGSGNPTDPPLEPDRVCDAANRPPLSDTASQGMFWVYRSEGGQCPAEQGNASGAVFVGYLFEVEVDDCPQRPDACNAEQPETVPFTEATQPLEGSDLPGVLGRYCIYRAEQKPNIGVNPEEFFPSLAVVYSASPPPTPYEQLGQQAEQHICLDAVNSQDSVRLTLVDTAPSTSTHSMSGRATGHGEQLAAIAEGLVCQGIGVCPIEVRHRNGMPLRRNPDPNAPLPHIWSIEQGGDYGSLDWLAQSIVREVNEWLQQSTVIDEVRDPLILNLSLAWHEAWGGALAPNTVIRPDVFAVYDALRYARCHGALIVAATGNRTGCELDNTPMYPAGWESLRITEAECSADFGIDADFGEPLTNEGPSWTEVPLVYAAGGLGPDQRPLGIARDSDQSHLNAYAQGVPVPGIERTLSGSSVGAMVVSVDAARRWSADRTLTADQVMARGGHRRDPDPIS